MLIIVLEDDLGKIVINFFKYNILFWFISVEEVFEMEFLLNKEVIVGVFIVS